MELLHITFHLDAALSSFNEDSCISPNFTRPLSVQQTLPAEQSSFKSNFTHNTQPRTSKQIFTQPKHEAPVRFSSHLCFTHWRVLRVSSGPLGQNWASVPEAQHVPEGLLTGKRVQEDVPPAPERGGRVRIRVRLGESVRYPAGFILQRCAAVQAERLLGGHKRGRWEQDEWRAVPRRERAWRRAATGPQSRWEFRTPGRSVLCGLQHNQEEMCSYGRHLSGWVNCIL